MRKEKKKEKHWDREKERTETSEKRREEKQKEMNKKWKEKVNKEESDEKKKNCAKMMKRKRTEQKKGEIWRGWFFLMRNWREKKDKRGISKNVLRIISHTHTKFFLKKPIEQKKKRIKAER